MKFDLSLLTFFVVHYANAQYLVPPPDGGTPAPGASTDCSAWVQQSYEMTCEIIEVYYGITQANFEKWVCQMNSGYYFNTDKVESNHDRVGTELHSYTGLVLLYSHQLYTRDNSIEIIVLDLFLPQYHYIATHDIYFEHQDFTNFEHFNDD